MGDSHALMLTPDRGMVGEGRGQGRRRARADDMPAAAGRRCRLLQPQRLLAQQQRNPGLAHDRQAHPVTGAVLAARWSFYNEQDTAGRRRRLAEPVLERCQRAQPRLFNDRRRRARRLHHGPGPEPARADRRTGAGAQASDRELPATGAAHRAAAGVMRGQAKRRRAAASRDMAGAAWRGGEIPQRPADRSGGSAVRPRHLLAVRRPRACYYVDKDHLSVLGTEMLYRRFERDFRWVYGDGPAK